MITLEHVDSAANDLGLDPRIILAVSRVESGKDISAFLFEPHIFSALTHHRYDQTNPDVSYPYWDRSKYPKTKMMRQLQFDKAVSISPLDAYKAASWGLFQIMGFNHDLVGYASPISMASELRSSEAANVNAFCRFIRSRGLIDNLRNHEWANFARIYNGPEYKLNYYDSKLAAEFRKISTLGVHA